MVSKGLLNRRDIVGENLFEQNILNFSKTQILWNVSVGMVRGENILWYHWDVEKGKYVNELSW